jgi:hypothetical protein
MKNYRFRREASPRSRILGVISVLDKRVQRAHYEHFLLKIAEAFDGSATLKVMVLYFVSAMERVTTG